MQRQSKETVAEINVDDVEKMICFVLYYLPVQMQLNNLIILKCNIEFCVT